jgi:hypothetical protein
MKLWVTLAVLIVMVLPALALADVVCPGDAPSLVPVPLDAGAVLELMLDSLVRNGVLVVALSALTIVGAPWLVAGVGVALVSLPRRWKRL